MKRKWHIGNRILITLIAFTCVILLTVALSFNLTMRAYIRSRVSTQLTTVSASASAERSSGPHGPGGGKRFDERPDRITGARGSAMLLDEDGNLLSVLHGDAAVGEQLAAHFREFGITENKTLTIGGSAYAISVVSDPKESGKLLLTYVDVTSLMALTHQVNLILLLVILAAVLLSVFLSRRFARSLAEPVLRLSDFAADIGGGDLTARDFAFQDEEFDALAGSMNRMASDLNEARHKQETFFQNVSHELRTPLTSIRGNAEGIIYGVMEPQNAADIILSETDKLSSMVEDILYLSRMGKAAPEGGAELLDLREVLSLCVSEQRAEAQRRGVSFTFDFDEETVPLSIREQDAQRLFGNLISNAVRYAAGEVHLTCRTEDGGVLVRVADDGLGISPEDLPHIFERFYKGKDGKHGIGLAIARSAAENYHGTIAARNESGAVFEVRFPV